MDDPVAERPAADPPFPRERVAALLRRLPAYARLAWNVGRDPRISRGRRLSVLAAAVYLVSPIDLVPGIIPVVGQLDDMVIALAALRMALAGLSPEARRAHLSSVGFSERTLDEDVDLVIDTGRWALSVGARLTVVGARAGARAAAAGARAGGRLAFGAYRRARPGRRP